MVNSRRYLFELGGSLAVYGVLLVAASMIERSFDLEGTVKLLVSLLPMIGAVLAAWAVLRALWRMDELQRRIQFDAIAIAFLGTALITFGWGFAESAGAPQLRAFAVWPIMGVLWAIGACVAHLRYR